jgi:hypothetical protein
MFTITSKSVDADNPRYVALNAADLTDDDASALRQLARDCNAKQGQMKTEFENQKQSLVTGTPIGTVEQSVSFLVLEFQGKITNSRSGFETPR